MRDVQKPDHKSLNSIIDRLRDGRFVIPDFQREFEWKPWDIRDLMRSIFLDYYIGSLLLWRGKPETFDALACEPIYGHHDRDTGEREHVVLDGQQRLTAMYYTFLAPDIALPSRSNRFIYFIRVDQFMDERYDEAFTYNWTRAGINVLNDPALQFERHLFPLSVIGDGGWALFSWVQGYEKYWEDRRATAQGNGDGRTVAHAKKYIADVAGFGAHMRDITEQYQIAYIELDRDLELDKVCDIFTQINSRGIRLDVFDLINALLKPKGLQLKHMWRTASERLNFVESERMNVYVLQVMSILVQNYCSPKYLYYLLPGQERKIREADGSLRGEVLVSDTLVFESLWDGAVEALAAALEVLGDPREFGVVSSAYLPYVSILPAFAALRSAAKDLEPQHQLDANRKIRHWYWASVFLNRYSGSVESTTARDFIDVKSWFGDDLAEPALIDEFRSRFRTLELRRETKRGTSVYNGIFNLLILNGAQDWTSGDIPRYGDLDDHHIVPKAWGRRNNAGPEIDSILNRTPLSTKTNRNVIRERLPNEYLPELIDRNGETAIRATLESHFISRTAFDVLLRDPFTVSDFSDFIAERQRTLQLAIQDLLVKERLDLTPDVRELDVRLESVELRLREVVARGLDGSVRRLPSHLRERIDQRIRTAARRNPALDSEYYETLEGKLEYADLRELEAAICSKALWPAFDDRFGGKPIVAQRFDQLAELRNAIRHSRSVDVVIKGEGEAAIIWFERLLM